MSETTVRPSLGALDPELRRYIEANWERILRAFNPRHLIAFGSRVNGTAKPDSDLDLIVVSDAPRTHDLENLAALLVAPAEILSACKPLTEDFPKTRYPDAASMPPLLYFDATTARERIEQAERIRDWGIEQIKTSQPGR